MFSFIKNRPPLIIFFLCLLSLAVTIFCFAFYIKNTDPVPDTDKNHDWVMLLKHFNSLDTCLELNDSSPKEVVEKDFIEMAAVRALVSINNLDFIKKFTRIRGSLTLDSWHSNCPKSYDKPSHMRMYFDVPEIAKTNVTEFDACVTIEGPAEYLPTFAAPNCEMPTYNAEKKLQGYLSTKVATKYGDFCKSGLLTKVKFYPQRKENFANYLSENEKSLIYVHLLWSSYFLIFVLLIIVIYGTLQSDYVFDKYLQKFTSRN